jgi:hypothetical protein
VSCRSCGSNKQHVFKADTPINLSSGCSLTCWFWRCGYTEFVGPGTELRVLRDYAELNEKELSTQAHEPAH